MRRINWIILTIVVSSLSLLAEIENIPGVPVRPYWDKFVILVWQFETDVKKDLEAYRSVNINGFHIDGTSKDLANFAKEKNIPFYVDHAGGKGDLHLNEGEVKKFNRSPELLVRPNSLKNPKVMARIKGLLKSSIGATKDSLPIFYSFDDEISNGSFTAPLETDSSPASLRAYGEYQKELKGSIKYPVPSTYGDVRKTLDMKGFAKWDLAKWIMWRTYMDNYFAEALAELTKYSNSLDPLTPAGFAGGLNPSPYGGMDYSKFTKSVQAVEAYDINGTNEILRSFWAKDKQRIITWFNNGDEKAGSWFLWYYMVHGVRGVIAWPAGWFKGNKAAFWLTNIKESIKGVQEFSKPILDVKTVFDPDPIAIYYSHPSIQVGWAIDALVHGTTWTSRLSSMDNENSTAGRNRVAWNKLIEDCGYQYNVVSQEHLFSADFSKKYKVLILPRTVALSDKEAVEIKKFVAGGGVVIADYHTGIFTELGEGRRGIGVLDDMFNLKRDESKGYFNGKTLTEVNGEAGGTFLSRLAYDTAFRWQDIVVAERGTTSKTDPQVKNKAGTGEVVIKSVSKEGKAYYLNLSPVEYTDVSRRDSSYGASWKKLLKGVLEEAGLFPRVELKEVATKITEAKMKGMGRSKKIDTPRKVEFLGTKDISLMETLFWKNGDTNYLCIVRNPGNYGGDLMNGFVKLEGLDSVTGEMYLELNFKTPLKSMKNIKTGKELGEGSKFTDAWKVDEANIYEFQYK